MLSIPKAFVLSLSFIKNHLEYNMRLIFIAFIICCTLNSFGQTVGIKMGYGFNNYTSDTINIQNFNNQDTLRTWIDNRGVTTYAGFFYRLPIEPFFIEIEPLFSTYRIPIKVQNIQDWNGGSVTQFERFTSVDLSLIFGVRVWETLRFQGGITGQYYFNLDSDMEKFSTNYSNEWEQYVQSWKVGAGIDLEKLTIEINYENPFATIGNNVNFFGKDYQLGINRKRLEVKLGFSLINAFK